MPALVIAAHPTKNASDDQLVPYGGGAILNEVDGNLTLAKRGDTGNTVLHWQGKFRGLEFQPINFRFEITACPEVIDNKGRQVQLPVLRPCTAEDVESRVQTEHNVDARVLTALAVEPPPSIREIAAATGKSRTAIEGRLKRLAKEKLTEQVLGKWRLTPKGLVEAKSS